MPKIGRNDPCYCGSGKKYKQCHAPIDAQEANAQRLLKQAPDVLLPKLLDAVPQFADELPEALNLFWKNTYNVQTVQELDEHEDRGSERFLTWFLFDHNATKETPFTRLAADPTDLELTDAETKMLGQWANVRLRPYVIEDVLKGEGFTLRDLLNDSVQKVEDHAAAKRVDPGDVLIVHLLPVVEGINYITGAAAHLTGDTAEPLRGVLEAHLEDFQRSKPDATYDDLLNERSHVLNHFVMDLPRDEKELSKLDTLVASTRAMLNVVGEQIGLRKAEEEPGLAVPQRAKQTDETAEEASEAKEA